MRQRRESLGLFLETVAALPGSPSRSVWTIVEGAGQKNGTVAVTSLRGIAKALRWTADSCERILAGGDPEPASVNEQPAGGSLEDAWAELRRMGREVHRLAEAVDYLARQEEGDVAR